METPQLQKTQLILPPEVFEAFKDILDPEERDAYILALRNKGWTLQSIAEASALTRERVRQIAADTDSDVLEGLWPVPSPPAVVKKAKREFIEPAPETLARLLELKPLAEQVRSNSPQYREEAEEYTRLINDTHKPIAEGGEGVTLYRLAKRLGVTHGALRFRLARYGYKQPKDGNSKVYEPILESNRVAEKA